MAGSRGPVYKFPDRPVRPTKPLVFDDRELAFKRINLFRNLGFGGCLVMLLGVVVPSGYIIAIGLAVTAVGYYGIGRAACGR
jgi:hypothetical protein